MASGVRFEDGLPKPSAYRHYRIRSVEGIDDPASMREVIARRLQRLLNEGRPLPDLIVIDGGSTQLTAACEAAVSLGLTELPMVGLAKRREEIYLPGRAVPLSPDSNSPGMRLLRHMRDEAHRFAITHQRGRSEKSALRHALDAVADIGPERKKAILRHMRQKRVEDATYEELIAVPGIGDELARRILHAFAAETGAAIAANKEHTAT